MRKQHEKTKTPSNLTTSQLMNPRSLFLGISREGKAFFSESFESEVKDIEFDLYTELLRRYKEGLIEISATFYDIKPLYTLSSTKEEHAFYAAILEDMGVL